MASRFLIGRGADGDLRWASIDPFARHTESEVAETRFGAYLAPWPSEESARQALLEAGCDPATITAEIRPKRARRHG